MTGKRYCFAGDKRSFEITIRQILKTSKAPYLKVPVMNVFHTLDEVALHLEKFSPLFRVQRSSDVIDGKTTKRLYTEVSHTYMPHTNYKNNFVFVGGKSSYGAYRRPSTKSGLNEFPTV